MSKPIKVLNAKQAKRYRSCILSLCVISLIFIFQPFSLTLFTIGSIGVIVGGLIFNIIPFCEKGMQVKEIVKAGLMILYVLIGFIAIASLVSYLYIVAFLGS